MSLSRREEILARHPDRTAIRFSIERLAAEVTARCPELAFAYLLGSAQNGVVDRGADLDLAAYFLNGAPTDWASVSAVLAVVEAACPGAECDLGILNTAGPVFRFQALQGVRLFVRDACWEAYAAFYSLTCREYEDWVHRQARWVNHRRQLRQSQPGPPGSSSRLPPVARLS